MMRLRLSQFTCINLTLFQIEKNAFCLKASVSYIGTKQMKVRLIFQVITLPFS